jgi:hypothetical protein
MHLTLHLIDMTERINLGGITNTTLHLETDGTVHVEEAQDMEAILRRNQAGRDHRFDSSSPGGFYREVAEVPLVEYLKVCRALGQQPYAQDDKAMELILKSGTFSNAPKIRDAHIIMKGVR